MQFDKLTRLLLCGLLLFPLLGCDTRPENEDPFEEPYSVKGDEQERLEEVPDTTGLVPDPAQPAVRGTADPQEVIQPGETATTLPPETRS